MSWLHASGVHLCNNIPCPLSAENAGDLKAAIARLLRESGATMLTFEAILDGVGRYTNMPMDLRPYEPYLMRYEPYTAAVQDALESCFTGKLPCVHMPLLHLLAGHDHKQRTRVPG
jgi:hypothetical protein